MNRPSHRLLWISCLLLALVPTSLQAELLDSRDDGALVRPYGIGQFSGTYNFTAAEDRFDSAGKMLYANQRRIEHGLHFKFDYGVTDRLTASLDIPLLYRMENVSLRADDFGFGDSRAALIYSLTAPANDFGAALFTELKMPSGDSDVQLLTLAGAADRELPLGSGQYDLTLGVQLRQRLSRLVVQAELAFVERFPDLVEYAQAFQTTAGSVTAVGNLRVNYGEEILSGLLLKWSLADRFRLGAAARLRYMLEGSIDRFDITATSIEKKSSTLPAGYLLTVTPRAEWDITSRLSSRLAVDVPLAGEDAPVSLADPLIGLNTSVMLSYGF